MQNTWQLHDLDAYQMGSKAGDDYVPEQWFDNRIDWSDVNKKWWFVVLESLRLYF